LILQIVPFIHDEGVLMMLPPWICADCGRLHGNADDGHVATFHLPDVGDPHDCCGWCGTKSKMLTEPRDYNIYAPPPKPMRT
jgi:hypothetical protein